MAKPKKVVTEEVVEGGAKAEDLEIISIGSLYDGPWQKKYWSSSRGKDRYPYPVGYHAVRAHNGSTCKIEIHEGPKGPSFVVTSADGHSFYGQTPDIACEKFQKKYCSRTKTWHGKRLLSKIDGVEFFGFKNSFVQRLLREMAANVYGIAEKNFLSSNFCRGACPEPDIRERPQITKKRNRRCETTSTKSAGRNEVKKPRSQELACNAEASISVQVNKRNIKPESSKSLSAVRKHNDFHELQGKVTGSLPMDSIVVKEDDGIVPAKDSVSESVDISNNLTKRAASSRELSRFAGYDNCKSTRLANSLSEKREPLDRSQNCSALRATEDKAEEAPFVIDLLDVENGDICAPDTLDFVQDENACSQLMHDKSNGLRDSLAYSAIPEGLVTDLHPEDGGGTSSQNANSEKSDFDSVGQEFKAMMNFLLPQAVPLLNKVPRKKKATVAGSQTFPGEVNPQEETNETSTSMDASSPATTLQMERTCAEREDVQTQNVEPNSIIPNFEPSKSVIPDSFEDDQSGDQLMNQVQFSCKVVETSQPSLDKATNLSNSLEELVVAEVLDKKPQDGNVCINESLDCRSPSKEVISEKVQVVCATLDDSYAGIEICPVEKDLKVASECTEGATDSNQGGIGNYSQPSIEENLFKPAAAENRSSAQVPIRVYSRKNVSKTAPSVKKFNSPLSESIICRNSRDDCVFGTPTSDICRKSSSDANLREEDFFGAKAVLEGQCPDSPIISRSSTAICNLEGNHINSSFHPSILHSKKSEINSLKELIVQGSLEEFNPPVSCQKEEISPHAYNKSKTKENKDSQDLKFQKDLELNEGVEGIVELVGCYAHPMPVLSVLLRSLENGIYICVSCGSLVDKKRTLFVYKVAVHGPKLGCPSFVGHTSLILPSLKDNFGREITDEKSCLQLTPDGQCLVFLGSIRTPYCREGIVDCLCSTCTSNGIEENAVKIVQIKPGYVAVVAKLKTTDRVLFLLVIEPNGLIAVGESGQLYLWEMNSSWSSQIEEFVIPVHDCLYPCIVELKRIPKCASLVVGHNGFGEFGIWDISRRVFISRFSAPSTSIHEFLPIGAFSWPSNGPTFMQTDLEEHVDKIISATKLLFSEHLEDNSFLPSEGEDIALWLLVSTISGSDTQHNRISNSCPSNPVRFWRLALLVKNVMVLGGLLDSRASIIGASAGHGIIGTHDGLVYMWELTSGIKLGTMHQFKGGKVSCIATDDSSSRVLAVAGDEGQLLVYLHTSNNVSG